MYLVKRTKEFEKAYKKIKHSGLEKKIRPQLEFVVDNLSSGKVLDKKYQDHQLKGEFKDYRECHIKPDILLMYEIKNKELILILINIGSHSQLFG